MSRRAVFAFGAALLAASGATAMAQPAAQQRTASTAGEAAPTSRARAFDASLSSSTPARPDNAPVIPRKQRPVTAPVAPSPLPAPVAADDASDAVWDQRALTVLDWNPIPANFRAAPDPSALSAMAQAFGWNDDQVNLLGPTSDDDFAAAALRVQQ